MVPSWSSVAGAMTGGEFPGVRPRLPLWRRDGALLFLSRRDDGSCRLHCVRPRLPLRTTMHHHTFTGLCCGGLRRRMGLC